MNWNGVFHYETRGKSAPCYSSLEKGDWHGWGYVPRHADSLGAVASADLETKEMPARWRRRVIARIESRITRKWNRADCERAARGGAAFGIELSHLREVRGQGISHCVARLLSIVGMSDSEILSRFCFASAAIWMALRVGKCPHAFQFETALRPTFRAAAQAGALP